MTTRALVTGASGMLGSYLVSSLRERGWSVRALVRSTEGRSWIEELGAELALGSLEDSDSLSTAARGCDVIFHAAAVIGSGGESKAFDRGNVEGTAHVVRAAEFSGARLVHVSSTAVYGRERYRDRPTDETVQLPTLPAPDAYGRSKQQAERQVLEAHQVGRIWAVVVRPPVMYGLRDRQFAPRIGGVLARGFFPRIGGGRTTLTLVHAKSVAEGAILAASTDSADGKVYLLTDDHPVTTTDLVRAAEAALGRRIWSPEVPLPLGRAGFGALGVALRALGHSDLARHARGTFEMLTRDNPFTSERARTELGWQPLVDPVAALTEALRWWHASLQRGRPEA
jgi:nucleoside-diphosphate-sugar epimerase